MYVIRPKGIRGTPAALARDLGCQTRRWPNRQNVRPDASRDLILIPVEAVNATPDYTAALQFGRKNKYGQRQALAQAGIPVPGTASDLAGAAALRGEQFVVRPLRHSGGRDYRVVSGRSDFRVGSEYISELYPKRREYRVIFVSGSPVVWMRKHPNDGVDPTAPWGHQNSRFQTIIDVPSSPLSKTDCVQRLSELSVVRGAHLVAADVLWAGKQAEQPYVVLELNFCPGLDIDNNRQRVVEAIRARSARN